MMDLALFDLDETLICGDSNYFWLRWLVSEGFVPESLRAEEQRLMLDYQQGTLSLEAYMALTLSPLAGLSELTLSGWVRRFVTRDILPRIYPAARERIAWHQQRGDTVMIISASGEHLVIPIAEKLNVKHVLAVGVEVINGRYSGNMCGIPTYQTGKVIRLAEWLRQQPISFSHIWAYSDSVNDLPLLERADYAIAVNPDPRLQQEAIQRQWTIYQWQK